MDTRPEYFEGDEVRLNGIDVMDGRDEGPDPIPYWTDGLEATLCSDEEFSMALGPCYVAKLCVEPAEMVRILNRHADAIGYNGTAWAISDLKEHFGADDIMWDRHGPGIYVEIAYDQIACVTEPVNHP